MCSFIHPIQSNCNAASDMGWNCGSCGGNRQIAIKRSEIPNANVIYDLCCCRAFTKCIIKWEKLRRVLTTRTIFHGVREGRKPDATTYDMRPLHEQHSELAHDICKFLELLRFDLNLNFSGRTILNWYNLSVYPNTFHWERGTLHVQSGYASFQLKTRLVATKHGFRFP